MHNVHQLRQVNQERTKAVRDWFMDQVIDPTGHACAVSVSITADGIVKTSACAVEPEHAAAMLDSLMALVARLEGFVATEAPELLRPGTDTDLPANVVPLRRALRT